MPYLLTYLLTYIYETGYPIGIKTILDMKYKFPSQRSEYRLSYNFYRATARNATHGTAVGILSVCPLDACILTKLNDVLQIF